MAYHFYVAAEGTKPGQLKGGSPRKGWKDGAEIHSFAFAVEVPVDLSPGTASGKRQHSPIVIKKSVDAASPQLFQALATNEVLNQVKIHYWEPEQPKEVVTSSVNLTQPSVSGATRYAPSLSPSSQPSGQGTKGSKPSGEKLAPTITLTQPSVSGATRYAPSLSPSSQPSGQGTKGSKPSGEKLAPTITLTNATIVSLRPITIPGAQGPCEQLELSPERIEKIMGFVK